MNVFSIRGKASEDRQPREKGVDQLLKEKQTVTIEAICRTSIDLDPEHRGVKKSALLENSEAHAYYREHSDSYRTAQARRRQVTRKGKVALQRTHPPRIDPSRDVERVRYRYLQMRKADLVERLLIIEQEYAEIQQQLAQLQFQFVEQSSSS